MSNAVPTQPRGTRPDLPTVLVVTLSSVVLLSLPLILLWATGSAFRSMFDQLGVARPLLAHCSLQIHEALHTPAGPVVALVALLLAGLEIGLVGRKDRLVLLSAMVISLLWGVLASALGLASVVLPLAAAVRELGTT